VIPAAFFRKALGMTEAITPFRASKKVFASVFTLAAHSAPGE
jgi:hypothetical protein